MDTQSTYKDLDIFCHNVHIQYIHTVWHAEGFQVLERKMINNYKYELEHVCLDDIIWNNKGNDAASTFFWLNSEEMQTDVAH